jgi:aldehyde:ferredoxin oxidoreductase
VAAHNGVGAVMGSKRLKAIAVDRGGKAVEVADSERLSSLAKDLFQRTAGSSIAKFGTAGDVARCKGRLATGMLPVKNYTTNLFPEYVNFGWENFGPFFEVKRNSCWACRFDHCHMMTVKEGRYAGYVGEEPEYEQLVHWGPLIGQADMVEAFVLSNELDRLGMDTNESGWIISWLMECYEKGLLTKENTDGIEMHWGDVAAVKSMLLKIARRQGIGDILAEGLLRSTEQFGVEARKLAIFTQKGNTPRAHDHRNIPHMMLDTCISDTGTDEAGALATTPEEVGLPVGSDVFSPKNASKLIASTINRMPLDDCLGMCRFNNRGADISFIAKLIEASTGWDFTAEEAHTVGFLVVNLLRVFNIRHGLTADLDAPSARYSSAPVDGPHQGKTMKPVWHEMVQNYYRLMGWDIVTSRPLPETLRSLGLEYTVKDIW